MKRCINKKCKFWNDIHLGEMRCRIVWGTNYDIRDICKYYEPDNNQWTVGQGGESNRNDLREMIRKYHLWSNNGDLADILSAIIDEIERLKETKE